MVIETWLKTDRKKPIVVKALQGNLFSADNEGNLIGVEVTEDGSPVTLSGSVTGYVIRADGCTAIITGTLSGNKASITLPSTCYSVVGPISIVIKIGNTTIGACHGYVYRTTTDVVVDPGHVIPSISELLAQIENCRQATTAANSAASAANTAAGSATSAASSASTAAAKIDTLTVAAQTLAPGSSASASVSEVDGHKHILFGIAKGDPGKDFRISKTFVSIAAMEAYTGTDVLVNDCVMIDTGSVEDVDTGKLYRRTENGWSYIGDLSGKQGIKGETGNGIAGAVLNQDYTLTITFTDGTSYTTTPIRGAQGVKGDTGNGIASTVLNQDYTLTITFTDGTSYTTTSIRGEQGIKGDTGNTGATPNMSIGTVQTLTPGSPATASITGTPEAPVLNLGIPKGDTGSVSGIYGSTIPMSPQDQTTIATAIDGKVSSSQGSANAGKVLGIGQDGNVLPVSTADFTGATASTAGEHGYVPAPAAGDHEKFLKGNGTWSVVQQRSNADIVDLIYPVGSIYMNVNSTSPATLFGGTWEQLKDRFLLGAGDTYTEGDTGGSANHTLTTDEMPSHNHTFTGSAVTSGDISANHTHTGTSGNPSANHHHSGPSHNHAISTEVSVAGTPYGAYGSGTASSYGVHFAKPSTDSKGTGSTGDVSAWHTHTTTTGNQSAGHTHSVTAEGSIGNTGFGTAFSIMPPYQVVYMWKRTA